MNTAMLNDCAGKITDLLQQQSETVNGYVDYLGMIKQVISNNDAGELNQLLDNNPINLSSIEACRQQCYDILQQQGLSGSEEGLQQYIEAANNESLTHAKAALDTQLEALEKSLLINDVLIQKNQQRIRQSIQILSGRASSADTSTYSRQGNKDQKDLNKRSLARA